MLHTESSTSEFASSVQHVRSFSSVQLNSWWWDRLVHAAILEKLDCSVLSDNVTLGITFIFHLPDRTTI